eukprot:CAMPEP_0206801872 /NCGR_PEP_ID=MMETSP0975-20121206/2422_1 /ASSEMBLY_ACC=CAM_ASM_000399 /TAXON_ID=483370 /ORGANISM="non described non described, Strain CCMP2097" /LENGTH=30 /DNA_ID= /DNA_START= /DNA_END= /DNA_ORIENTATION=
MTLNGSSAMAQQPNRGNAILGPGLKVMVSM